MATRSKLFDSRLTATQAEVERAETLLTRDGLIPVEDEPAHRGALELWRRHCQLAASSRPSMLAAVRNVLELPSCTFERGFDGLTETTRLAWVRPADIWFNTGPDFPYHFTVEGLAQLASNLITEQGDPWGMARIFGDDYSLSTVAAPHGLLHEVSHNGNHRTAAIKAAGFPVALVQTVHYEGPWKLPLWGTDFTVVAYLRLLFRAGLLTKPHGDMEKINAEADRWANLLLADNVGDTLRNVAAYEQFYGRCEAWPNWLRDGHLLTELLNRELLTMDRFSPTYPDTFSEVTSRWPPSAAGRLKLLVQRLARAGARLDGFSA